MTMANPTMVKPPLPSLSDLKSRAQKLGLWGVLAHWAELEKSASLETLIGYEEEERRKRTLESRLQRAKIGAFKSLCDFDWSWPKEIDRELVEDLFRFEFLAEAANV